MNSSWRRIEHLGLLGVFLVAWLAASCTRPFDPPSALSTPAVSTLIAPGTRPAPLETLATLVAPVQTALPTSNVESQATRPAPGVTAAPESSQEPDGILKADTFAVILLAEADVLNVRSEPGLGAAVLETLPAQTRDLRATGQRQQNENLTWIEIQRPAGGTGWISGQFLTEQVAAEQFCADSQVSQLLDLFQAAIQNRDGKLLAGMISPVHGLTVYHNSWNPPVYFDSAAVVVNLFSSTVDYDWGVGSGSGLPLVGPFKERILPQLQDVLTVQHERVCNKLEQGVSLGGTTATITWPAEYVNLNYVALYRPAPLDMEQNWRTWVVGIEYVDGLPYITVLVQYDWEI